MSNLLGRWDLVVSEGNGTFPSWLELTESGGRFVGRVGSSRPIVHIVLDGDIVEFSLPPQYESRTDPLVFKGKWVSGSLVGTTTLDDGTETSWIGNAAPALPSYLPQWGDAIELIGQDLSNWIPRSPETESYWGISEGMLVNSGAGSDLVTKDKFSDFRLVAEYSYPKDSNSGIYLRGRYEFQILDDFEGKRNGVGNSSAIYGFLAPKENSVFAAGEWNRAEITLLGRIVTVVLNGVTVIDQLEIPGITGGALDSAEGEPGPLFVQGDHGPVTFRRLTLTPAIP